MKQNKKVPCVECNSCSCYIKLACNQEELNHIDEKKISSTYVKGQQIIFEGEVVKGLFFIREGKVKVVSTGLNNRTQIVRLAKSGGIIGHRGYGSQKYPVGAIAMEKSEICFLNNDELKTLHTNNSQFTYQLMICYSEELRKSESKIKYMAQMNVTEKVADSLLYVAQYFGVEDQKAVIIDIDITRQDIADLAGINKEQLSRVLSDFKKDNILTVTENKFIITDISYLQKLKTPFN